MRHPIYASIAASFPELAASSTVHRGQYGSANLRYYPAKNILTGVELLHGTRENGNGANGSDSRVRFTAKFDF